MWSIRILIKYALIQLPGALLILVCLVLCRRWIAYPAWVMWAILGIWVAKDVVLYPFVWRAYQNQKTETDNPMIGQRGIVKDRVDPAGYVFVRGELWKARTIKEGLVLEPGDTIIVRKRNGLTLYVEKEF